VSVGFIYPGQGLRLGRMLDELPDLPVVHRTLSEADAALPEGIASLDPPSASDDTVASQLGLLVRGVAATRALAAEGASPDIVAGHSVGAFAAAVAVGALEFSEALQAVSHRAHRMAELFGHRFGMLAVMGLSQTKVREIVKQVSSKCEPLWLANVNTYDQMVLTGTLSALDRAAAVAEIRGALRTQRLDVPIASHGPLLAPVAAELCEILNDLPRRPLDGDYIMISSAKRARGAEDVLQDLAMSVALPVLWRDTFGVMIELGAEFVLQLPPGHALVSMANSSLALSGSDGVEVRAMSEERLSDCVYRIMRSAQNTTPQRSN
jgi:malonate decarboxylase epsilon subunit